MALAKSPDTFANAIAEFLTNCMLFFVPEQLCQSTEDKQTSLTKGKSPLTALSIITIFLFIVITQCKPINIRCVQTLHGTVMLVANY